MFSLDRCEPMFGANCLFCSWYLHKMVAQNTLNTCEGKQAFFKINFIVRTKVHLNKFLEQINLPKSFIPYLRIVVWATIWYMYHSFVWLTGYAGGSMYSVCLISNGYYNTDISHDLCLLTVIEAHWSILHILR